MSHHIFEFVRSYLAEYGYWAVAVTLLLENAGIPLPGETVLLMASFLAFSEHRLHLPSIIVVGICAATIGDNLGFLLGHYGGRPLLERYAGFFRIKSSSITRGEQLFVRYGAAAVFVARFIAGMRIVAGPLAGTLRMHWRKFALFNFLGAVAWVTLISGAGYLFGAQWERLMRVVRDVNVALLVVGIAAVLLLWWRKRLPLRRETP
jgi:membrane protein DedA with SNARE-associated domain